MSDDEAAVELCCRCGRLLMRWWAAYDEPFPERLHDGVHNEVVPGTFRIQSPGIDYRLPAPQGEDAGWHRYAFTCHGNVQIRQDKLEVAVAKVLRHLHDTRGGSLQVTVGSLLRFSS